MVVVPRMIPMIDSPDIAIALAARWQRVRVLVLVSMVVLPMVLGFICLALALLTHVDLPTAPWWSAIPAVAAVLCGVALVVWLRRDGLTDPASWFPATVLMTGSQLVLGVVPGFGIAVRSATGTAVVVKALFALGILGTGSAWSIARRACRSLLAAPVAELGSTPLRLVFRDPLSRMVIGADRVDWTFRVAGGRIDAGASFRHLRDVSVDKDGAAVVLHTSTGRWRVPVRDAAAVCEVLKDRKSRWEQRVEAAIDEERQRYHDMVRSLGMARATASTPDRSVSVTVNADGITTHVELTDDVRNRSPQLISADLMACLDRARLAVREQVQDVVLDQCARPDATRDLARATADRLAV